MRDWYTLGALGDYSKSSSHCEQALRIFCEINNQRGEGRVLNNLGIVSANLGGYSDARVYYEQALCIFCEIGDQREKGIILNNLGNVSLYQGDYTGVINSFGSLGFRGVNMLKDGNSIRSPLPKSSGEGSGLLERL